MIAPKFVDLASANQDKLVFLKVNVDDCEVGEEWRGCWAL